MIATWETNTEGDILLGAMSDIHVQKCIWALEKKEIQRPSCHGFSNAEWIKIFKAELTRRSCFATIPGP